MANAHLTGNTADVDDLAFTAIIFRSKAASLDPISSNGLGREEQSLQIEIEYGVPILLGNLG